MSGKRWSFLRLLAVGVALAVAVPGIGRAAEFSADFFEEKSGEEKEKVTGKIYVKGNKIRLDQLEGGAVIGSMLSDHDKGTVFVLNHEEKTYMRLMDAGPGMVPALKEKTTDIAEVKELGRETVHGYNCQKTRYTYKDKQLGSMVQWYSEKLGHVVKMDMEWPIGTIKREHRNIKEGKQPDSLFTIPAGYKKESMP
jgi:hypothetical protein